MYGQLFPDGGGLPIALVKETIVVGRAPTCDVVIPSRSVSGRHCQLSIRNGYWWVKDLDSRNGTGINGRKIDEKRILPDETLCLPRIQFRIVYKAPHEADSTADEMLAMSLLTETEPRPSTYENTPPTQEVGTRPRERPRQSSQIGTKPESSTASRSREVRHAAPPGANPSGDRPMRRYLGKLTPNEGGAPIALLEPNLVVGRSRSCNIRLKVSTVSSRHCSLTHEDGYWFVEDLSSSNGVKVNGERIDRKILMPGDQLSVSTKHFVIEYTPEGEPPRDSSLFSKSLLEKAGLANVLESKNAPGWVTSHESEDNERRKFRLDDSDPD